jgi:RNA polymerase sigma-70 factor (ECF subfamily)
MTCRSACSTCSMRPARRLRCAALSAGDSDLQGSRLSDDVLVKRAQEGDRASFDELTRRYGCRIRKVTGRLLANDEDADEAVRETFLRAFRFLPKFEYRSSFFTWLYRIAVNVSLSKQRKRRTHMPVGPGVPPRGDAAQRGICASSDATRLESSLRDIPQAMRLAIDDLPADYRSVVALRLIEGLSNLETSEKLHLSVAAVKSRLHRGRLLLRERLPLTPADPNGSRPVP